MQKKSNALIFVALSSCKQKAFIICIHVSQIESFWCPLHAETMFFFFLSYEEYDNFAENKIISLDQQAMWV